jgi:hypothetical protein
MRAGRLGAYSSLTVQARPLALAARLIPIGRSAFAAPSDAKLACLDRDHEEKISHRVSLYQVRECSLAIPLPVGHSVAKEAQRRVDLGQAAIGPSRTARLAPRPRWSRGISSPYIPVRTGCNAVT